jgi:hypothetical protein
MKILNLLLGKKVEMTHNGFNWLTTGYTDFLFGLQLVSYGVNKAIINITFQP